jgi:sugar phosphate isomerase/epimerase
MSAQSLAVDFFWRLGEIGRQRGIVFCLEPNPTEYGCDFMVTDDEAYEMVKMVDHNHIALQLDTGAALMNDDDITRLVSQHTSAYGHIHLSATGLKPLHLTPKDFHDLPAFLQRHLGPLGYMTIEMLTSKPENAMGEIEATLQLLTGGFVSK